MTKAAAMKFKVILITDIEELSLTFNQIKNLISNFNNENLSKAVKFAEDITEMSKK